MALVLTWLLKEPFFTDSQLYVLFLFFFAIGLWLTEAIPAFAVSLFIIAYLVFTLGNQFLNSAPENIAKYVNTFSSSIIWLLLGGLFLAKAMTKTKFDERILSWTLKISGTRPRNIVIAFMFTTMVVSMFMSNTAATAMIVAVLLPLLNSFGQSGLSKALLLGLSVSSATGGMATIIGTPPNAIAAGMLKDNGVEVDFLGWMLYGMPVCIALTAIGCIFLIRFFIKDNQPVNIHFLKAPSPESYSKPQRKIVVAVLCVTLLLWLTTDVHHISVSAVSAIPIVAFTLSGIISDKDINAMPWDVLILVAGSLSLGTALESTGILEYYSSELRMLHVSPMAFLFIFAFLAMILANVMVNAAACAILLPLEFAILPGYEKQLAIITALATSSSIFLPVSTPPNAIVYGTGFLQLKDLRLVGILIGILGPLLAVLWVHLVK